MLTPVPDAVIPKGAKVTPCALMPKILCCIEGDKHHIYVNKENVRTFKYFDNAIKKMNRLNKAETTKAKRILESLGGPVISARKTLSVTREVRIGFDDAI